MDKWEFIHLFPCVLLLYGGVSGDEVDRWWKGSNIVVAIGRVKWSKIWKEGQMQRAWKHMLQLELNFLAFTSLFLFSSPKGFYILLTKIIDGLLLIFSLLQISDPFADFLMDEFFVTGIRYNPK